MTNKLLRVYSHPRSGTNLLMTFIGRNFYPEQDLSTDSGKIGHWSDRKRIDGNPYGRLAGHHHFFGSPNGDFVEPALYIFRDGRSVAASLWQTKIFQHPDWRGLTFSEFLRGPLDWIGSPSRKPEDNDPPRTIAQHWLDHLASWANCGQDVLMVRYEQLVHAPLAVRELIAGWSGMGYADSLCKVDNLVGWFPHGGGIGSWRSVFTKDDLAFFHGIVQRDHWGLTE